MDLYKKFGDKAKKAYQNWACEPKIPYELLEENTELSLDKRWILNGKSPEEEDLSDRGSGESPTSSGHAELNLNQEDERES